MKKIKKVIILIIIMGMGFSSCSSNNDGSENVSMDYANITGNWVIKQIIKSDGSKIDYVGECNTEKDYFEFTPSYIMQFYRYDSSGKANTDRYCSALKLNYDVLGSCDDLVDGIITKLTAKEMQINYGDLRSFYYGTKSSIPSLGIVLVKK